MGTRGVERAGLMVMRRLGAPPAYAEKLGLVWHTRQLFASLETDCVIDVGANRGQFAHLLRNRVGFEGQIVSFEPQADAFAELVASRDGDKNWSGRQVALGTNVGTAEINVFGQDVFTSFLTPSSFGKERWPSLGAATRRETVQVRRLDSEWPSAAEAARSVFLKLDTQGRDLDVLASSTAVLEQVRGLVTEVPAEEVYEGMVGFTETIGRLLNSGFRITGLWPETREADMRVIEFNCFMRRP
jgi:FkbM family methyltransferase